MQSLGVRGKWLGKGLKRVSGSGIRVQGLGFRVQGLAIRDSGLGFRAQVLGFTLQDSGIRKPAERSRDGEARPATPSCPLTSSAPSSGKKYSSFKNPHEIYYTNASGRDLSVVIFLARFFKEIYLLRVQG